MAGLTCGTVTPSTIVIALLNRLPKLFKLQITKIVENRGDAESSSNVDVRHRVRHVHAQRVEAQAVVLDQVKIAQVLGELGIDIIVIRKTIGVIPAFTS
jgi:hypothetical protein